MDINSEKPKIFAYLKDWNMNKNVTVTMPYWAYTYIISMLSNEYYMNKPDKNMASFAGEFFQNDYLIHDLKPRAVIKDICNMECIKQKQAETKEEQK